MPVGVEIHVCSRFRILLKDTVLAYRGALADDTSLTNVHSILCSMRMYFFFYDG